MPPPGQTPRSVTQIVEGVERLGLVARTGAPEDRRRKTVSLTAAEQAGRQVLCERFGSLGPRQLAVLDGLLAHLADAVTGDKTG